MAGERIERRLAAILAADIAGYSRLIGMDEEGTLAALRALRRELIDPAIAANRGRIVKTTGDGVLVEFASVLDALRAAAAVQAEMARRNADIAPERRIAFRIGIHQGDIVVEDGDIFGDGVNVAARLEGLAEPGGICVSARVQEDAAGRLDLAFEDLGEPALKNIARPVRVYRVRTDTLTRPAPPALGTPGSSLGQALSRIAGEGGLRRASAVAGKDGPPASGRPAGETPAVPSAPLSLPDKPSIAVLPFQNMSGDPEQEYFVDGMVEEIITALSRIRWLFVIARNSSFTYKGQAVDIKRVGRELGVRYVLEGSVRKGGNRVRITAQLIEAATGAHLWADRFDGTLEDVFDLQDRVASNIAGVIEPALQAAEIVRSTARPTADLTAYDLYLRGFEKIHASRRYSSEALRFLEEAIARDPEYGPALALAARVLFWLVSDGHSSDPGGDRRKAIDFAKRALEVAANDPGILANVAQALAYFGEDMDAMLTLADRAVTLNPNFATGWFISATLRNWAGQPDVALKHIETSLRLSPRAPIRWSVHQIGLAYFLKQQFEEAVPRLLLAIQVAPGFTPAYLFLASAYAHMGRLSEAREIIARRRTIAPLVITDAAFLRDPAHRELFLSGLRLALGEAE